MLLTKTFDFDAAHRILGLPKSHKCSRVHGHTYRVEIGIRGTVIDKKTGFLAGFDFADLAKAWVILHELLDHRDLNKVSGLGNPTCENLTMWIMERLSRGKLKRYLAHVRVYESNTTYCHLEREEHNEQKQNR